MAEENTARRSNGGDDDFDGDGGRGRGRGGNGARRRRMCRFCADEEVTIDYKNPQMLKYFITDRGKMIPRRITGTCAKHQRKLAVAIKRSRMVALMPFTVTGK